MSRFAGFLAAVLLVAAPSVVSARQPQSGDAAQASQHQHPSASVFKTREASGTSWLPDLTPMFGSHINADSLELMFHGNAFGQFLYESGETHRTSHQAGSMNWFMAMARRPIGTGRLGLRTMISLEPWSINGCGYPNLLATGELCDGDGIHDRQHPHDLFMEIAADYERPITDSLRWLLYAGLAGEPALGPPGFPHRLSAFPNPIAPISHHWLDSTHIAFGVITSGIATTRWKAEGSLFNGREPDNLRRLGFKSVRAYKHSQLWRSIEARVLTCSPRCRCCGQRRAERVHHRAFDPATLTGESIAALTALCERCFRWSKRAADNAAMAERIGALSCRLPHAPLFAPFRGSALPRRRRLRKAPRPALTTIAAPRLRVRHHGGGEE